MNLTERLPKQNYVDQNIIQEKNKESIYDSFEFTAESNKIEEDSFVNFSNAINSP